jgi:SsrA-binding protein
MARSKRTPETVNRKAEHGFHLLQKYEAGIVLSGTEVKAIRDGKINMTDAFCYIKDGELWLKNMYIAEYSQGSYFNHETRRNRKLLLKADELKKLDRKMREKGFTIIPYRLYFSDRGFVKCEVALATGKKSYDKRQTIKDRDNKREMDRLRKVR